MSVYEGYKNAEEETKGLFLSVEGAWLKTEQQLHTICKIWDTLNPRLQTHLCHVFEHLESKLQTASAKLEKLTRPKKGHLPDAMAGLDLNLGYTRRIRVVVSKDSMRTTIRDLKEWQERLDPSWLLIPLIADPVIDRALGESNNVERGPITQLQTVRNTLWRPSSTTINGQASVFLDRSIICKEKNAIPLSSGTFISYYGREENMAIIDTVSYAPDIDPDLAKWHIRDLARVLSSRSNPSTSGLLACEGVIQNETDTSRSMSFDFVFSVPQNLKNPRLLRSILVSQAPHPLDERLDLAKSLARSIMFVHTSGFVHKNIRPETILVFENGNSSIGEPYLIGFERFRPAAAGTARQGDSVWERNLYRHPRRQGLHPEDFYKMQHDIYSLGVCLLELGLWTSFVSGVESGAEPTPLLDIEEAISMKDRGKGAFLIKRKFTEMAETILPSRMGTRYSRLVVSCLTCLDPDDTNQFGKKDELKDEDGVVVGVQYIEKVGYQLCSPSKISLMRNRSSQRSKAFPFENVFQALVWSPLR